MEEHMEHYDELAAYFGEQGAWELVNRLDPFELKKILYRLNNGERGEIQYTLDAPGVEVRFL